ncbi:hypothetical protein TNCV_4352151 [Trichonephila clavipes]|nr:hypothetical protein TNCV_4352151 [Trichonephila clavipes]
MVRSAATALDSSLSTIRRVTLLRVFSRTIHRRLIQQNLLSYRPLHHLPLMPSLCRLVIHFLGQSDLSPIEHVWGMMVRRSHLTGNVDDLARQFEQIWQETPRKTMRVLYPSIPRRVTDCIQFRGGSTPY